jgi:hypothetical protein
MQNMTEQSAPKRRGNPAWVKGGPSPNPLGRPRTGLAFAERLRERVDPDVAIDLLLQFATDDTVSAERRLATMLPWLAAGYMRPPTTIDASVTSHEPPSDYNLDALSVDERRTLAALLAKARVTDPSAADAKPSDVAVVDDNGSGARLSAGTGGEP